jgi:hypothetical protein
MATKTSKNELRIQEGTTYFTVLNNSMSLINSIYSFYVIATAEGGA